MPKCHIWAQAVTQATYYIKWLQIGRFWYEDVWHVKCTMMKDSLKRGNKMPTRCSGGFYCTSYCLLNMFREPLCPSSGAHGVIRCLLPVVFRAEVFNLLFWCGAEGYVSGLQDVALQQIENHSTKYLRQQPLNYTLELLMMGIVVPETYWESNKICNKNLCCI